MVDPHSSVALRLLGTRDTIAGDPRFALQSIDTTILKNGALVYVIENTSYYGLSRNDNSTVADGVNVVAPDAGPGRWFREPKLSDVTGGAPAPRQLGAPDLDDPNNADWFLNALAPLPPDSSNAAIIIRSFPADVDSGAGWDGLLAAADFPLMRLLLIWRNQNNAEPDAGNVLMRLAYRQEEAGQLTGAWASTDFAAVPFAASSAWVYTPLDFNWVGAGLIAEEETDFELIPLGGPDKVNDPVDLNKIVG